MLILGDARIPGQAKENLFKLGTYIPILTSGITYEAISGHPDIFFCLIDRQLVVAPNIPKDYLVILKKYNVSFTMGSFPVGNTYPETARYNAVVTGDLLIHNEDVTDESLKQLFAEKKFIHVNQAYTRCNLIPLRNGKFITSDEGISKTLKSNGIDVEYFSPEGIVLPGFDHGFLGGTLGMGLFDEKIFLLGQLKFYPEGDRLGDTLSEAGYEIIELYSGPLFDGGCLLILP